MKIVHRNALLPIGMIRPHPDNPRKEVGDVTELAESIRANGIFQNLTVIRQGDGYTCLIGHRRLAAAKLAGVDLVPCMVVEMDEKEQAQGFQMMLDLGETQESISEKTGFSKTTVRHRLKLLELDPEEFLKSQERQTSLSDYIELEKISDPELKNNALKAIGTANFKWSVQNALREEKYRKNIAEWKEFMSSIGTEVEYTNRTDYRQLANYYAKTVPFSQFKEKIEGFETPLYYTFDQYGYLYLLGEKKEEEATEAEPEWKIKARERQARIDRISEIEGRARELRLGFVKKFVGGGKHLGAIVDMMIATQTEFCDANWQHVAELCGITIDEEDDVETFRQSSEYTYLIWKHPEIVLLAILADTIEDWELSLHDYSGDWRKNESLEHWYELLEKLGYQMSDDEKRLLDGTHECFEVEL